MLSRHGKLVARGAESLLEFLGIDDKNAKIHDELKKEKIFLDADNATVYDILKIQNLNLGEFDGDVKNL